MLQDIELLLRIDRERRRRKQEYLKNYKSLNLYYQKNPLDYFKDRLKIKPEMIDWSSLKEYEGYNWDGTPNPLLKIVNSLVANKWVGVESATGTGKTFLGALIVLWFLESFENSIVVTTAPKQDQLTLHIWKEIGKLFDRFGKGELTTLKIRMNSGKDDWIAVGFVAGVKANEESATKAQGFHAEHMLIILEETPGIPAPIINALQNTCTSPHNLILAFGNPDHQMDNLHRFCTQDNVAHVRISGYDHPNVVLNDPDIIPGATSREGLNRIISKYGAENPLTLSRTRGISPVQGADSLILMKWCIDAKERDISSIDAGPSALGVDVANSEAGDKAAIAYGIGGELIEVKDFQCPDSNQLGKRDVFFMMKEKNISGDFVGVDGVGVGAGTVNGLKELGLNVLSLIGSEAPLRYYSQEEDFNNLRSQMYWQMREDLKNGRIKLPNDDELFADLITPKWSTKNGKIIVESKEEIKKRLGHSPNKGDAAVYWNWVRRMNYSSGNVSVVVK